MKVDISLRRQVNKPFKGTLFKHFSSILGINYILHHEVQKNHGRLLHL